MDINVSEIKKQFDLTVCEANTVYNIYECGCIINHKKDTNRKIKCIQLPPDEYGNRKRTTKVYCGCKKSGYLLTKYKWCQECRREYFSIRMSHAGCYFCETTNRYSNEDSNLKKKKKKSKKIKKYGRLDEIIKSYKNLTDPEKSNCLNRNKCLELSFCSNLHGLACKNCEYYVPSFEINYTPSRKDAEECELDLISW